MHTWARTLLVLLALLCGAAHADCIISGNPTMAAAYAQCESAMKQNLVPPRIWTSNQCAATLVHPPSVDSGFVQCLYEGDWSPGQHSCSGCFGWGAVLVDKAKNCCSPIQNGSDPISTGLGFTTEAQTDFPATAQGFLGFTRFYTSYNAAGDGWGTILATDLGPQWRHTYARSVLVDNDTTIDHVVVLRPSGEALLFRLVAGIWTPDPDVALRLQDTFAGAVRSGWDLTATDDSVEHYDVYGKLQTITTRGRFVERLTYDAGGLLQTVNDGSGRTLSFRHDPTSKLLTAVTANDGTQVSFGYAGGYLSTVTYPGASVRTYKYGEGANGQPWQLTGLVDENGSRYSTWQYDAAGRAWLSVHGDANSTVSRVELSYAGDITRSAAATVTSKLWTSLDGTSALQRNYQFNVLFGVVKLTSVDRPCNVCADDTVQSRTYDGSGYPATSTDFNAVTTRYTYDDSRGLETQRVEAPGSAAQRTTDTTWNAAFRLPERRAVRNANGDVEALTTWAYNERGQATARCQGDPTISAAAGYVCGASTNAPVGVRQSTYTYCDTIGAECPLIGLLLSVDGPRTDLADVTSYAYYASTDLSGCGVPGGACHNLGDLQSVTDALGHVTTYVSYDKNGRVTRIQDANGSLTDMAYQARGWLLARTVRANADGTPNSALDAVTTFSYDAAGNVTQVTQPDGTYLHYVYDAAHRLTDVYDSATPTNYRLGDHIHYTLDAAGNRVDEQTSDANGTLRRELSRTYDGLNRLVTLLNSSKVAVQTFANPVDAAPGATNGYDGNGNAIYSFDGGANHVGTEQQYDPLNRLVKTLQDHVGTGTTRDTTTRYAYDARDNLRSVTDPDGLVTSYTYDGLNRLTDLDSPDTGHTGYGYDEAGNRTQQTDARGVTSTYRYDALNRLIGIDYPTAALNLTYAYDQPAAGCFNLGHLTVMTDSTGSTQYCYDRRGNVLKKTQIINETRSCLPPEAGCAPRPGSPPDANPVLTESAGFAVSYKYTLADRVAAITYTSGAVVTYGRDSAGRINGITYQAAKLVGAAPKITVLSNVSYYPFGPANVLTFGNGRTLTKTYDTDYAIRSVVSSGTDGLVIAAQVDPLGNLTAASDTIGGAATQQYSYDALYRLTGVQDGNGNPLQGFSYSPTGDRLTKTDADQHTQTYRYESGTHHLAAIDNAVRTYDANGNTVSGGLSYDDRNRLSGWNLVDGRIDLASNSAAYGYNARGERVAKQLTRYVDCTQANCRTAAGTLNAWQTATEAFVYDESGRLLGEYPGIYSSGDATDYIYLDGTPVAMARGGVVYYVETDQLGTSRKILKPAVTSVVDQTVWKWDYFANESAFGENAPSAQAINFNLRFPGQYYDAETGSNYNLFRDYEPRTGKYVESDPIGLHGGPTTYAYAMSSPVNQKDRLGLASFINFPPDKEALMKSAVDEALRKLEDCQEMPDCYGKDDKEDVEKSIKKAKYVYDPDNNNCGETRFIEFTKIIFIPQEIRIGPGAFNWNTCCDLASTIAHEANHYHSRGTQGKEPASLELEKKCFNCPRTER